MNEDEIHDQWATRTGAYSPAYYAYYGPNETSELIGRVLSRVVDRDAAILELGCSSGRHLAHLHEHGYENLHGVDINDEAFDVMDRTYPDLADAGTFYQTSLEDLVRDTADGRFDVVYSAETLQHLHPDTEWVFDELTRLTSSLIVTAETDADADGEDARTNAGSSTAGHGVPDSDSTVQEVRHDDDVPLYVRDWSRVFTERGWIELEREATPLEYHTLRAFRPGQ